MLYLDCICKYFSALNIAHSCISESGSLSWSRSLCSQKMRCQTKANRSQDTRKLAKNVRKSQRHRRSTKVVQPSLRKTRPFSSIPMLITRKSPFFSTSRLIGLFLFIKVLKYIYLVLTLIFWIKDLKLALKINFSRTSIFLISFLSAMVSVGPNFSETWY